MCDFSLESVKSRAAVDNEDLVIKKFSTSKGFISAEDPDCAVCCKSGVEMSLFYEGDVRFSYPNDNSYTFSVQETKLSGETPVVFHTRTEGGGYRDGLILADGKFILLQHLLEGTRATVTKALPKEIIDAANVFDADIKMEMVPDYTPATVTV